MDDENCRGVLTKGLRYRVKAKHGLTVDCPQYSCAFQCRVTGGERRQNFMCSLLALTPTGGVEAALGCSISWSSLRH